MPHARAKAYHHPRRRQEQTRTATTPNPALLRARTAKLAARKQWMADHLQLRGAVTVDAGASAKLLGEGKSLLPVGVVTVEGEFARGEVIAVRGPDGMEIARGLANYAAGESRLIARRPSSQIEAVLGYSNGPELIHRDNMVRT